MPSCRASHPTAPRMATSAAREAQHRITDLARVTKHAVQAPVVVWMIPGPVFVKQFEGIKELPAAELRRAGEENAAVEEAATAKLDDALRQRFRVVDVGGSSR